MNPIAKFEWKDNIEQEKDLLEYITSGHFKLNIVL